jgi:hypothetical protein
VVAGLSVTQRLLRQRSSERSAREPGGATSPIDLGPAELSRERADKRPAPVAARMERVYREGRQALKLVRKKPSAERWNELGQRSKDLGHAARRLEASRPKRMTQLAARAQRLSSLLGDDRDLGVLEERTRHYPAQLDAGDLAAIHALIVRRRDQLQGQARGLAERLYRRKPRKFMRRLGLD